VLRPRWLKYFETGGGIKTSLLSLRRYRKDLMYSRIGLLREFNTTNLTASTLTAVKNATVSFRPLVHAFADGAGIHGLKDARSRIQ